MSDTVHLHWGAEALWQQLEPLLPGLSVEVVARTDSTNTQLLTRARHSGGLGDGPGSRHAELDTRPGALEPDETSPLGRRAGDRHPCLLVAEHQTHGRGRQGKTWQSTPGASLTFSLALPLAPVDWSGLSLAVGLALAEALDPPRPGAAPRLVLKWPNDLLLVDDAGAARKLGGILIETVPVGQQRMAVIGIGLNILPQPLEDPGAPRAGLPPSPPPEGVKELGSGPSFLASLGYACLQELDYGITAPQALARIAQPLVAALLAFEREGFAPRRAAFARRDMLRGRAVTTTLPGCPAGVADGVDDQGVLWLRVDGERRPVASGEVSVRLGADPGAKAAAC